MPAVMEAIDKMSTRERVETMGYLWDLLSTADADYEPPLWHGKELARRRALYDAGKIPTSDWSEVEARLDARAAAL